MSNCLSARVARFVAASVLFAAWGTPAAALEVKPVPSVHGMAPKAALALLEREGFTNVLLRLDGMEKSRAEIEATAAVAAWTSPPEWKTAHTSGPLEVGFETYVRVVHHVGQDASEAAEYARAIGYMLVKGHPDTGTPILATEDGIIDSYHSDSPEPGAVVAVGGRVGVIMSASAVPEFERGTDQVLGAVICAVIGAVTGAGILKLKASKG